MSRKLITLPMPLNNLRLTGVERWHKTYNTSYIILFITFYNTYLLLKIFTYSKLSNRLKVIDRMCHIKLILNILVWEISYLKKLS